MGLETVELVMEVESTFSIKIEDREAGNVRTVGHLCDLVCRKLSGKPRSACMTAKAFFTLRRALQDLGIERKKIRPDTPIEAILPTPRRRTLVSQIRRRTHLKLPAMRRAGPLVFAIMLVGFACAALAVGLTMTSFTTFDVIAVAIVTAIACWIIGGLLTLPWKRVLDASTMGEFSLHVAASNYWALGEPKSHNVPTDHEIRQMVHAIVANQLGLRLAQVHDDSRFAEDLNAD